MNLTAFANDTQIRYGLCRIFSSVIKLVTGTVHIPSGLVYCVFACSGSDIGDALRRNCCLGRVECGMTMNGRNICVG